MDCHRLRGTIEDQCHFERLCVDKIGAIFGRQKEERACPFHRAYYSANPLCLNRIEASCPFNKEVRVKGGNFYQQTRGSCIDCVIVIL